MTNAQIISFLKKNPGSIAAEIGVANTELKPLEADGQIIRVGTRSTGKRGRPPVEWAVSDVDFSTLPERQVMKAVPSLTPITVALDDEAQRQVEYIDRMVSSGQREDADIALLLTRRKDILRTAERQNRPIPVDANWDEPTGYCTDHGEYDPEDACPGCIAEAA